MLKCPDLEETLASVLAITPRGRAWQNTPFLSPDETTQRRFWRSIADPAQRLNARLCALVDEFFCESAVETRDIWAAEYGLPDACDPFADLCAKVDAVGDTTAAYAEAAALLRGWLVVIDEQFITASMSGYAGLGCAGGAIAAAEQGVTWLVMIDTAASPAWAGAGAGVPLAGAMLASDSLACPPDISSLECVLRRIAPAQVDLVFNLM